MNPNKVTFFRLAKFLKNVFQSIRHSIIVYQVGSQNKTKLFHKLPKHKNRSCGNGPCRLVGRSPKLINFSFSFIIYLVSVRLKAIASIGSDLAPRLGTLGASVLLHCTILSAMMRAPLMFFDQTPIGRILSRFSSDIDATDQRIPEIVSDGIYCFFEVTKTFVHFIVTLFCTLTGNCASLTTLCFSVA